MGRRPSVTQADILPRTGNVGGPHVWLHVRLAKVPTERLAPSYRSAMIQAFSIEADRNGAAGQKLMRFLGPHMDLIARPTHDGCPRVRGADASPI